MAQQHAVEAGVAQLIEAIDGVAEGVGGLELQKQRNVPELDVGIHQHDGVLAGMEGERQPEVGRGDRLPGSSLAGHDRHHLPRTGTGLAPVAVGRQQTHAFEIDRSRGDGAVERANHLRHALGRG